MEKDESKEVFCDIYCNRGYDSHRCSEETNELFIGCDMKNITDVFENEDDLEEEPVTYFPCKVCDNMFDAHEKLKAHFVESHTLGWLIFAKGSCGFTTSGLSHSSILE